MTGRLVKAEKTGVVLLSGIKGKATKVSLAKGSPEKARRVQAPRSSPRGAVPRSPACQRSCVISTHRMTRADVPATGGI